MEPDWDVYRNNHFALRKRCLDLLLKSINKLVIRHRAGQRLVQIKQRLKDEAVRTKEDCKRMIKEDWKTA